MIAWAIEALIASTLLMLLVLVLRAPVRRAFGAGVAYALWLLPVARLLLPPLPAEWQPSEAAPISRAAERVGVMFIDLAGGAPAPELPAGPDYTPVVLAIWAIGAIGFIGWHLIR
ncbi:MAG: peptidase M56, partial [Sphingomonas sp.]|nr:peptidase M56 [Sphingomonas sp.]